MVFFYTWNNQQRKWVDFGQTEQIQNSLNPDFKKSFAMAYSFEKMQKVRFVVQDVDVTEKEEIGYVETTIGNIMGARNQTQTVELKYDKAPNSKRGQIILRAESRHESNHSVILQVSGEGLANKGGGCVGMCSETLPVKYEIQREIGGVGTGHFSTCYISTEAYGTVNPSWQPHKMRLTKFSNGQASCRVKFRFMCGIKEIGHIITTANQLMETRSHDIKKGVNSSSGTGKIEFKEFQMVEVPSFVDYLRGGWQISLAVAIDFTASNGNPMDPRSLHA